MGLSDNMEELTGQTPFRLVYGVEAVMPMEYIVPSLRITTLTGMTNRGALEERLAQLAELEEEIFLAGFHQQVQKHREKAWHDWHIRLRTFKLNYLVLLYDSKFDKFPGKLRMHWLGSYVIKEITDGGVVQLFKLNGDPFRGKVSGSRLKPYTSGPAMWLYEGSIVLARQVAERRRVTIKYIARVGELRNWRIVWNKEVS